MTYTSLILVVDKTLSVANGNPVPAYAYNACAQLAQTAYGGIQAANNADSLTLLAVGMQIALPNIYFTLHATNAFFNSGLYLSNTNFQYGVAIQVSNNPAPPLPNFAPVPMNTSPKRRTMRRALRGVRLVALSSS